MNGWWAIGVKATVILVPCLVPVIIPLFVWLISNQFLDNAYRSSGNPITQQHIDREHESLLKEVRLQTVEALRQHDLLTTAHVPLGHDAARWRVANVEQFQQEQRQINANIVSGLESLRNAFTRIEQRLLNEHPPSHTSPPSSTGPYPP